MARVLFPRNDRKGRPLPQRPDVIGRARRPRRRPSTPRSRDVRTGQQKTYRDILILVENASYIDEWCISHSTPARRTPGPGRPVRCDGVARLIGLMRVGTVGFLP